MSGFSDKKETELNTLLVAARGKLSQFRFAMAGSKTKNVKEGKGIRKEIAQILTELSLRKK